MLCFSCLALPSPLTAKQPDRKLLCVTLVTGGIFDRAYTKALPHACAKVYTRMILFFQAYYCTLCLYYLNKDALYHLHYIHYDERLGSLVKLKIIKHTSIFIVGASNKPILEPSTTFFCPNVNVTYSCHATNVDLVSWTAYPYFYGNGRVLYAPGLTNTLRKISDNFYTEATNVTEDLVNEVTTVLTVITRTEQISHVDLTEKWVQNLMCHTLYYTLQAWILLGSSVCKNTLFFHYR